jgi:hypothetical protein
MPETVLKFPAAATPVAARRARGVKEMWRRYRRVFLLVVVPLIAAGLGLEIYLSGGRYISTDNAYVGAQKVLITPGISGKIASIAVTEGQHVNAGDELFAIDPVPFQLAVTQAESKLAMVRTDFANLKTNLDSYNRLVANIFSSIGISGVIAELTNTTTVMHARLVENVTPFNNALQMPDVASTLNLATDTGKALLDQIVTQQATIIAYANDFKLLMLLALVAMPLVLLMGSSRSEPRSTRWTDSALPCLGWSERGELWPNAAPNRPVPEPRGIEAPRGSGAHFVLPLCELKWLAVETYLSVVEPRLFVGALHFSRRSPLRKPVRTCHSLWPRAHFETAASCGEAA